MNESKIEEPAEEFTTAVPTDISPPETSGAVADLSYNEENTTLEQTMTPPDIDMLYEEETTPDEPTMSATPDADLLFEEAEKAAAPADAEPLVETTTTSEVDEAQFYEDKITSEPVIFSSVAEEALPPVSLPVEQVPEKALEEKEVPANRPHEDHVEEYPTKPLAETPTTDIESPPPTKTKKKKQKKEPEMNPKFKDVQETGKWGTVTNAEIYAAVAVGVLVIIAVIVGVVVVVTKSDGKTIEVPAQTNAPTMAPTALTMINELEIARAFINGNNFTKDFLNATNLPPAVVFYEGLRNKTEATAQERAMSWLLYEDDWDLSADVGTRWALASIYFGTGGESWSSSAGWLSSSDACEWEGIRCESGVIQDFSLEGHNLTGTIPVEFVLLDSLRSIVLSNNALTGTIPGEALGSIPMLTILYLDGNQLTGTIPAALRTNQVLDTLFLQNNDLTGSWPREFCPASLSDPNPIGNFGIDCDKVECPGCCDDYSCYYSS